MERSRRSALRRTVRDHPLGSFVMLALGLSWLAWAVPLSTAGPASPPTVAFVPGGFGPAVAAAATTWLAGDSVSAWLGSLRGDGDTSGRHRWLAAAFGLPLAAGLGVGAVLVARTGSLAVHAVPRTLALYLPMLLFGLVVGGGQEELGWRGFALPRLQRRYSALTASLLLGVVWAVWHAPLFLVPGGLYTDQSFALYVPVVLAVSVLATAVYNGSGGSVPAAMLLHAGVNTAPNLAVPLVGGPNTFALPLLGVVGAVAWTGAAAVVVRYGSERLAPGSVADADATVPVGRPADGDAGGVEA